MMNDAICPKKAMIARQYYGVKNRVAGKVLSPATPKSKLVSNFRMNRPDKTELSYQERSQVKSGPDL